MKWCSLVLVFALFQACAPSPGQDSLGSLELGLSSRAGDALYRLSSASFMLEGPNPRAFSAEDEDKKTLHLPVGRYSLMLEDGWVLARVEGDQLTPVSATLISDNPAAVVITSANTSKVVLRFALEDGAKVPNDMGDLSIELAVGEAPAQVTNEVDCAQALRISELDYDQVGSDTAEFIEVLNAGTCVASLRDVALELVNGGDGQPYARIALSRAGGTLGPSGRVVVGDEMVRTGLPPGVLSVPLPEDLQNGAPDAVRLMIGATLIDAVSYEGVVSGASEGAGAAADEGEGSLSRCPETLDSNDNAADFMLGPATPGLSNTCG